MSRPFPLRAVGSGYAFVKGQGFGKGPLKSGAVRKIDHFGSMGNGSHGPSAFFVQKKGDTTGY